MIVCDCRNISDEDPDWKEKVLAADFKCGQCQIRFLNTDDDIDDEVFHDTSSLIDDFIKKE